MMGLFDEWYYHRKGTIFSSTTKRDRSMFSMVRYSFLLDAPFNVSNICCNVMKKKPFAKYHKETGRNPITAQMACESRLRKQKWLQHSCNQFDGKKPISNPMSFWLEQDVLQYIAENNLKIASVYGDVVIDYEAMGACEGQMSLSDYGLANGDNVYKTTGCRRTGCVYCGFGCHVKADKRFVDLKKTHPKIYDYIMRPESEGGMNLKAIIDWTNEHGDLNIKY